MKETTKQMEAIYDFIASHWQERRRSPSLREIARTFKMGTGTVTEYLSMLEAQGRIERDPYKSRTIRLANKHPKRDENAETVYDFLRFVIMHGITPTHQEISRACFLSRREVRRGLAVLEAQGRIERGYGQRNIILLDGSVG